MGNFNVAEMFELVGLYLPDKLSTLIGRENVGLYRNDGLATINNSSGPVLDKMTNDIIALSKTTEINLFETDFFICKL